MHPIIYSTILSTYGGGGEFQPIVGEVLAREPVATLPTLPEHTDEFSALPVPALTTLIPLRKLDSLTWSFPSLPKTCVHVFCLKKGVRY